MKILQSAGGLVRWVLNTAFLLLIALLIGRALVEYAPALGRVPLFGALVRRWDPTLQALVESVGLRWSHDVRGLGLPGVAVALLMLRVIIADAVMRTFSPKPTPRPTAPAVPAAPPAPVARSAPPADDLGGTVLTGSAGVPSHAVQSVTGTAFLGSQPLARPGTPALIGRYQILEELGRGAMGTVYKAQDPKIGRMVAIKTISSVGAGPEMEQYRQRFLLEAKSAGRLNHPSVVAVHDVAEDSAGRPCLVLEYVDGTTLDRALGDEPLPLAKTLEYMSQIARALAYAHGHGVVHRDIKPANIMVTKAGLAKLSDFGIAKVEGTTLTMAGQVLGTPAYMSPEQCQGLPVDYRSDLFSLGAVLYTLVTGSKPFPGQTFTSVAYQVVHTGPIPVQQIDPSLPAALDGIISRCLAKDPAQRYDSATQLADAIDGVRVTLAAGAAATAPAPAAEGRA